MILAAIVFAIAFIYSTRELYLRTKKHKRKKDVLIFFDNIQISWLGACLVAGLLVLIGYIIVPPNEYTYSLRDKIEVISIGYNESMPPANFILDGNNYRYISKDTKDRPKYSSIDASRAHVNYTDGPAYVEVYETNGFKHNLTYIYGSPGKGNWYYEIYAPEDTIQGVVKSTNSE